jgi:hypothetical protein
VTSEVTGGQLTGVIDGNDNRLNIGSVQMTEAQRGEVMTKTDLGNVSVSMAGNNSSVSVDSVVAN